MLGLDTRMYRLVPVLLIVVDVYLYNIGYLLFAGVLVSYWYFFYNGTYHLALSHLINPGILQMQMLIQNFPDQYSSCYKS